MILKKLEIQGFKSFADRTEILFSPGVIAVVGPNGSGKSNISDAILWVLGEQNVRALRGQKGQDVIFSGTDKRRPVGMAEVSLTVDNSSGKLPIDFSEVTVTRRAYRSGESEFFINKTHCRLKDIAELFMDTGVGHEAYSIVSQGEMDVMLSANPEDRRSLFDEAAGIKKYRHRKKEAERKLESTEANLYRVNDIVSEIEDQIEPMREQAEIAKEYLELTARLQEIEVGILVNDLHRFTADIKRVGEEKESDLIAISDTDTLLIALEEEKSALSVDLSNADAQVERFQAMYQEALTLAERTESRLALSDQRHLAAEKSEVLLAEEIEQIKSRIAQLEEQRLDTSSERDDAEREETYLREQLSGKTAELKAVEEKIALVHRAVDEQKTNYIELAKQLATQRNELANVSVRVENMQALLSKRGLEYADIERKSNKADSDRDTAEKELADVRIALTKIAETIKGLREKTEKKQTEVRQAADQLVQLNRTIVDKQSRLKTLIEMEEAREGYFQGVRSVMAAVKAGKLSGQFAVVADVIKVPKGYETAYEVALGSSLQDIITDSDCEAKSAIEFLKQNRAGRATFLPLNMMRHNNSPGLRDMVGKQGVLGLGNEIIKFDKKYSPAVDSLLGRVLIVEDIDCAVAVSKSAMGWSKIVTLDGELVFPSGAMTGGHAAGKTVNLLGRKQEIDALKSDVKRLDEQISALEKAHTMLQAESGQLSDNLSLVEEEDRGLKVSVVEKERRLEFAVREAKRLAGELEAMQAEKSDLQENIRNSIETRDALATAIESTDIENVNLDDLMVKTEVEVKGLREQYDSANTEISGFNIALASITQKMLGIQQSLQTSETSRRQLAAEIERKHEQMSTSLREKADTDGQRGELEAALEKARKSCEELNADSEEWRKTKHTIFTQSAEVNDRMREVTRNRETMTQRVHSAELKEARLDMAITQTTTRMLQDYDITAEEAFRQGPTEVEHGSAAEVMRLRRDIKQMGEVNTGAVQEYNRLTERFEFLSVQRQDLIDARLKLVEAIREIDLSTRGIFMETFESVSAEFSKMFLRLFGGGKTELILTDPDNILETGIEVLVELPGKKRQNLLLLSGGERALTASALMFALMTVRPSPFCLLDEVDAPLDESNIERFADVIKDFSKRSQMIIITHSKATMESADILYGVTMQEPGVSKIVSVKLSEMAEKN